MSKAGSQNEKTISSALKTIIETFQANIPETESSLYAYFMGKEQIGENQIRCVNESAIPMWYLSHHRKRVDISKKFGHYYITQKVFKSSGGRSKLISFLLSI